MGAFLEAVGAWTWALGGHWSTLQTGGFIIAIVTLILAKTQKTLSWKLARRLAFGFMCISFFQTWRDEYDRANSLEAKLRSKPQEPIQFVIPQSTSVEKAPPTPRVKVLNKQRDLAGQLLPVEVGSENRVGPTLENFEVVNTGDAITTNVSVRIYLSCTTVGYGGLWVPEVSNEVGYSASYVLNYHPLINAGDTERFLPPELSCTVAPTATRLNALMKVFYGADKPDVVKYSYRLVRKLPPANSGK